MPAAQPENLIPSCRFHAWPIREDCSTFPATAFVDTLGGRLLPVFAALYAIPLNESSRRKQQRDARPLPRPMGWAWQAGALASDGQIICTGSVNR